MAGKILCILARPADPCAIRWVRVGEFEYNHTWIAIALKTQLTGEQTAQPCVIADYVK
ncbi:MAG TPA: hypothetical protein VNO32_01540 [Candidatus Acidoferrum sp.]|nr:hypothetical protein [Candidatus Acidoferrum sp.]